MAHPCERGKGMKRNERNECLLKATVRNFISDKWKTNTDCSKIIERTVLYALIYLEQNQLHV